MSVYINIGRLINQTSLPSFSQKERGRLSPTP
nr:MAG TPA: hypothetical protein [Caudoviricetes sp.]